MAAEFSERLGREHAPEPGMTVSPADFPPIHSVAERLGNLPLQVSSFIGSELDQTAAALDDARLVTLTGLGRSGTVAACYLLAAGIAPDAAIAAVRTARGPRALETTAQEGFVVTFPPAMQRRR